MPHDTLDVNVRNTKKSKNSFGNSFALDNESADNQFLNMESGQNYSSVKKSHLNQESSIKNKESPEKSQKKGKNSFFKSNEPHQVIEISDNKKQKNKKTSKKNITNPQQQLQSVQQHKYYDSKQNKFIIKQSPTKQKQKIEEIDQNQQSEQNYGKLKNKKQIKVKQQVPKNEIENSESKKISNIQGNISRLNDSIHQMRQDYYDLNAADQLLYKKNNRNKELQIRQFLTKKRLEKEKRQKKIQKLRIQQQNKISATLQIDEIKKARRRKAQLKKLKKKEYIEPRERKQAMRRQQMQRQKKVNEYYSVIKERAKQPFHIRKQRQAEQAEMKRKQQQEQILMVRKQRYQSLDEDELEQHKKFYEDKLEELECQKRQAREQQINKIIEDNQLMNEHLWRGRSHDIVEDEILDRKNKKKQPKQKVKKMKNYYQFIRKNYAPKTHPPKQNKLTGISKITQSMGNHSARYNLAPQQMLAYYDPGKKLVRKYKYMHGNSLGTVLQSVPVAKSIEQQKMIGQGYLQHFKSLPKKKKNQDDDSTQIDTSDLQLLSRKFNSITRVKKQVIPFYGGSPKQNKIVLSAKPNKQEVKMVHDQLKNQDIKLKSKRQLMRVLRNTSPNGQDQEKQLNKNMILNMERKLDLLGKL